MKSALYAKTVIEHPVIFVGSIADTEKLRILIATINSPEMMPLKTTEAGREVLIQGERQSESGAVKRKFGEEGDIVMTHDEETISNARLLLDNNTVDDILDNEPLRKAIRMDGVGDQMDCGSSFEYIDRTEGEVAVLDTNEVAIESNLVSLDECMKQQEVEVDINSSDDMDEGNVDVDDEKDFFDSLKQFENESYENLMKVIQEAECEVED